jgi:glycosyltransferase involved in cell wall biosynthesis
MNEAENVEALCERLHQLSKSYAPFIEAIFVLNNTTDGTDFVLKNLSKRAEYPFLRITGSEGARGSAIRKGVEMARGEIVVVMDSDGQYDPLDVPKLLRPITHQGYSIAIGRNLTSESLFRRITSEAFKKLTKTLLGVEYVQTGFKAGVKSVLLDTIPPDVPGLDIDVRWANNIVTKGYGDKLSEGVEVNVYPRMHGESTFNPLKLGLGLLYTTISLSVERKTGKGLPFPRVFKELTLYPKRLGGH